MIRNLVVLLACAALLAFGLSISSFAGAPPDTDLDGVPDTTDNCTLVPNGPSGSTGSCDDQEDGDGDGFGNPCDTDYNNNGATELTDLNSMLVEAIAGGTDPNFDPNCNGASELGDLNQTLVDATAGQVPGPSCCAP